MILSSFLQNIDFSPEDFEDSSLANIRKKLVFEEEEETVKSPLFLEDFLLQPQPKKENNASLLQKRIRPFNLQLGEMENDDSLELSNNQKSREHSVKDPLKLCEKK